MREARSMFCSTVIDDKFLYVYGGISKTVNDFSPELTQNAIERYDAVKNEWSNLIIEGTPSLSAFGWSEGL